MKYFLDTEFIEGFHKPILGRRRHHIDLISIGIVCEDGRKYYAISNEYRYKDCGQWVRENVILPMYLDEINGDKRNRIGVESFHKHKDIGKSNKQISEEIIEFCADIKRPNSDFYLYSRPEFYAYYADYDWVLFCSLFGTMMELPKRFPMYCRDLKQMVDDKCEQIALTPFHSEMAIECLYETQYHTSKGLVGRKNVFDATKHPNYPKQTNEHNAIADAKWNFELYKFLQTINP